MKKYLMRGPEHIKSERSTEWVIANNGIASNSGNTIYQNSVYQMLSYSQCIIDMDDYAVQRNLYSEEDIDYINSEYDGYLCPLADVFREDFMKTLDIYVSFINKLKIPFYIIGVGLRAPYEPDRLKGFPFDSAVKRFIKAVLNHSSVIGLRGEITGQYLNNLGFRPEKDYTVIGCPSLYRYGKDLSIRKTALKEDSKVNVNFNFFISEQMGSFLYGDFLDKYPNSFYTGQGLWELKTLYLGHPHVKGKTKYFPYKLDSKLYKEDKVAFHTHPEEWIYSLRDTDLSIGGRFHGNISALLAGCPAVFIPIDARMRELTDYHNLSVLHLDQCKDPDLFAKYTSVYYDAFPKAHERNFSHFIDFLHANDIEPVFDHADTETITGQFDEPAEPYTKITSYAFIERNEQVARAKEYEKQMTAFWKGQVRRKLKRTESRLKAAESKAAASEKRAISAEKQVKKLENQLDRKAVKAARRFADAFNSLRKK